MASDPTALLCEHLVGQNVLVRLRSGSVLSGVLHKAVVTDKGIAVELRMARERDDVLSYPEEERSVPAEDVLEVTAKHVETHLKLAGFKTDTEISKGEIKERRLERWDDTTSSMFDSLDDDGAAEWDQFAVNEKLFGVKTDFDENKYTTELDKSSAFYKERIATADRIARLIESAPTSNPHLQEERGQKVEMSEEDLYSGVLREGEVPGKGGNRYVIPSRRKDGQPITPPEKRSRSPMRKDKERPSRDGTNSPRVAAAVAASGKFGAREGSPNRKRGATPPTDSLNLESSMPKVSGKAIDTFVNFAEEQRHQHKQVEIEDFKKFSQQLERRKSNTSPSSSPSSRSFMHPKETPSLTKASSPASTSTTSTSKPLTLNPNAREFTLSASAREFTPGAFRLTPPLSPMTPAANPTFPLQPQTLPQPQRMVGMPQPHSLPQPPLSILHPPDRRPPPIDLNQKVSDLYNSSQRANDEGKRPVLEQVPVTWVAVSYVPTWRTYNPSVARPSNAGNAISSPTPALTMPGIHYASSGGAMPTPQPFFPGRVGPMPMSPSAPTYSYPPQYGTGGLSSPYPGVVPSRPYYSNSPPVGARFPPPYMMPGDPSNQPHSGAS